MLRFSVSYEATKFNMDRPMPVTKIVRDDWEVDARLAAFRVTRAEIIGIVRAAVASRKDSVLYDPCGTEGTFSYTFGTRALREVFCARGYEVARRDNIEGAYDAERGVKMIFQNAAVAADPIRSPRAIHPKGNGAVNAIEIGQGYLFRHMEEEDKKELEEDKATLLVLFVSVDGDEVTAELSCPSPIPGRQFSGFHERIFILRPGEWGKLSSPASGPDFEISVTRK